MSISRHKIARVNSPLRGSSLIDDQQKSQRLLVTDKSRCIRRQLTFIPHIYFNSLWLMLLIIILHFQISIMSGPANNSTCGLQLSSAVVIASVNLIFSVMGIVGNFLVCLTVYKAAVLRTQGNAYLVFLAVADLIVNTIAQPLLITLVIQEASQNCNKTLETVYYAVFNFSSGVSILVSCSMTTERFLAIVKPIAYRTYDSKQRFYVLTSLSLMIPLLYTILQMTTSKKGMSYFGAVMFATSGIYLLACYFGILVKLLGQRTKLMLLVPKENTRRHQIEKAVKATTAIIIGVFTITWLPCIYFRIHQPLTNNGIGYMWASTSAMSNSSLNPIIYALRMQKFKNALRRVFAVGSSEYSSLDF